MLDFICVWAYPGLGWPTSDGNCVESFMFSYQSSTPVLLPVYLYEQFYFFYGSDPSSTCCVTDVVVHSTIKVRLEFGFLLTIFSQ